ncbi:MAG: rhodanese-like domain-containing protein [Gammaproteobacteria bacterium]|nr:rhodanese-like domain-containing protein [Gammaproteobacteria bacterium]
MKNSAQLVEAAKSNIKEVTIEQLKEQMDSGIVVIDVREPGEYSQGHIPKVANLPRGILEMNLANHPAVKEEGNPLQSLNDKGVYLICRSGARSALAAESMVTMGFDNVYSVAGGMMAWQEAGFEME